MHERWKPIVIKKTTNRMKPVKLAKPAKPAKPAAKPKPVKPAVVVPIDENIPIVRACVGVANNWGDALGPVMFNLLSGHRPKVVAQYWPNPLRRTVYLTIGSILSWADVNTVVWGSGFIALNRKLRSAPKQICAVRGPLTRELLLKSGVSCPEIYGDPALLYPRFYNPRRNPKYDLGIIPHYIDARNPEVARLAGDSNIKIINIKAGIKKVVDAICQCRHIASSSLHGVIAADAYGIPSLWLEFGDRVIGAGFKFKDYFASIGYNRLESLRVTPTTTTQQILNEFDDHKIDIDLDKLLTACPFRQE